MHLLLLLLLLLEVQLLLVWNRRHGFGALRTNPAIAHLVLYLFGLERARSDSVEVSCRVKRLRLQLGRRNRLGRGYVGLDLC